MKAPPLAGGLDDFIHPRRQPPRRAVALAPMWFHVADDDGGFLRVPLDRFSATFHAPLLWRFAAAARVEDERLAVRSREVRSSGAENGHRDSAQIFGQRSSRFGSPVVLAFAPSEEQRKAGRRKGSSEVGTSRVWDLMPECSSKPAQATVFPSRLPTPAESRTLRDFRAPLQRGAAARAPTLRVRRGLFELASVWDHGDGA